MVAETVGDDAGGAVDRSRRPAWLLLAAATLLVPTALAGLTLLWPRPQIEDQLTRAGGDALSAAGFASSELALDGRDATIGGVARADAQRAVDVVKGVAGIRVAAAARGAGAASVRPFGLVRRGQDIVLSGVIGSQDERARLVDAARSGTGATAQTGRTVVDELTVAPGVVLPPGVGVASVRATAALLAAASGPLAVDFGTDGAALRGTVADEAAREAALQGTGAALPGMTIDDKLTVAPPPAAGPEAATTPELDDTTRQQLQAAIDGLVTATPITFEPDSPALTTQSGVTVGQILELVRPVAGVRLRVDGFVATGPAGGVLTAQQLSDQRAVAIRDFLVTGGVPVDRIEARGLGEGDRPAGLAAGRRVEITVV